MLHSSYFVVDKTYRNTEVHLVTAFKAETADTNVLKIESVTISAFVPYVV